MNITDESRQKFGEALAGGINALLGRNSSESWLTRAQYQAGHVQITESLRGGSPVANYFAKQVEAISPAITHVTLSPISMGDPATYSIGISFDTMKAEALYSDGKSAIATLEKDGKKYVVTDDGTATEVEDPDKYVNNLNKTTGSRYQKQAEGADDAIAELGKVIADANTALEGTGVEVLLDGDTVSLKGDVALVKPTQRAFPDPLFGIEELEGGYNADAGAVEVTIPKFADTRDIANIREFLYKAVNIILDISEQGDYTEEDEWSRLIKAAEPDDAYASRYSYAGESFVAGDKAESAKLIKSLLVKDFSEAKAAAESLMGVKMSEAILTKIVKAQVSEDFEGAKKNAKILMGDKAAEVFLDLVQGQSSQD